MPPIDDRRAIDAILLLSIDPFPHGGAERLVALLSRRVSVPCRLRHVPVADGAPLIAGRAQLDADHLLGRLEALHAEPGAVIVGLTDQDIGTRIFSFVFGRARREGHAALVSTARLDPGFYGLPEDADLRLRRAVAEVIHEIGHVAGLEHCADSGCIMRFATNVESIDLRGSGFCAACAGRLPPGLPGPSSFEPDFPRKPEG